jgi:hypothetical protein
MAGYFKHGIEASSSIKGGSLPFQELFCLLGTSLLVSYLAKTKLIFLTAECYWLAVYSNL